MLADRVMGTCAAYSNDAACLGAFRPTLSAPPGTTALELIRYTGE
jgi:hypothetical protein